MLRKGDAIELESFKIIDSMVDLSCFDEDEKKVVKRAIHATGDLELYFHFRFSKGWKEVAKRLFSEKAAVITDVKMVKVGISSRCPEAVCMVDDPEIIAIAKEKNLTRSEAGIAKAYNKYAKMIFIIGNAPTALLKLIEVYRNNPKDIFVIGIPVGFVSASESKEMLSVSDIPHITLLGTKGGSPIAAAVFNSLWEIRGLD